MLLAEKTGFAPSVEGVAAGAVGIALLCLGFSTFWEFIPGTYHTASNGWPRGTGRATYYYECGALKLEEWYRAGILTKASWYRPDGTEIATSRFDKESGGVGYYLREDGSIKSKLRYEFSPSDRMYVAEGTATHFAPDGSVEESVEYENGAREE